LISNDNLFFLDESGFNLHTSANFGYSPINTDAYRTVPKNRGKNISLLLMISFSAIVKSELVLGSFNSSLYLSFLVNAINSRILNPGNVLVCDNVNFHKSPEVVEYLSQEGTSYMFLPPYTPQFNPVEEVFSCIKNWFSNIRPMATTSEEIIYNIKNIIAGINDYENFNMLNLYMKMRRQLDKAYNYEDL